MHALATMIFMYMDTCKRLDYYQGRIENMWTNWDTEITTNSAIKLNNCSRVFNGFETPVNWIIKQSEI